ncbi:hypothetical protein APR04_005226 [Promicromonospora umidemergens]|nr:hypothetical protein [Promicromonospora umidemergens]
MASRGCERVAYRGSPWRRCTTKWCAHSDLRRYGRTPGCAAILVCAERALVRHYCRMDVYALAGRPAEACGPSRLAKPPSGDGRARTRSDFHVPPLSNSHELGDMRSPCSPPCPPPGILPRKAAWGTSTGTSTGTGEVHNREDGTGRCRCMRANSDMHGGGKLPPPCDLRVRSDMPRGQDCAVAGLRANPVTCGGANLAPPCDLGFYQTADAPLARSGTENKPDNNGSAELAEPYDLGRCSGPQRRITESRCRCRRRSPATAPGRPPPNSSCGKRSTPCPRQAREANGTSTVPPIWRDRTTCANAPTPIAHTSVCRADLHH